MQATRVYCRHVQSFHCHQDKHHSSDIYETIFADHHISFLGEWLCSKQLAFGGVNCILWNLWLASTTNIRPLDGFLYNKKRSGDIEILDHLKTVIASYHVNALRNSYQQLVSSLKPYQSSLWILIIKHRYKCRGCFLDKPISWCVPIDQDLDYLCLRYLWCMMCLWHQPERSLDGSNYWYGGYFICYG